MLVQRLRTPALLWILAVKFGNVTNSAPNQAWDVGLVDAMFRLARLGCCNVLGAQALFTLNVA